MKGHAQNLRRHKLPPVSWFVKRFRYDPATGVIYHRDTGLFGDVPVRTYKHREGYRFVSIRLPTGWAMLTVHRLAWLLTTGAWPDVIDHINGSKDTNCLSNLRNVTASVNQENTNRVRFAKGAIYKQARRNSYAYLVVFRRQRTNRARFCDAVRVLQDWRRACEVNRRIGAAERP